MNPEHSRHERFIEYTALLRERFDSGMLAELQDLPQWVVWRGELEDNKPKKVPYNPQYSHLQARASVKIPKSWESLDQALTALESGSYSGLGFMITPPLVMIDLDHSVDRATHTITDPQAATIVQSLNSYTEASPSGTGLHILTYGQLPGKGIHTAIEHRTEEVTALYHQFAPPVKETVIQNTRGVFGAETNFRNCHRKRNTTAYCNGSYQVTSPAMPANQTLILC